MTDEEVELVVPDVEVLVDAVMSRDLDGVKYALELVPAGVSAIVLAELLGNEREARRVERARIVGERDRFQLHYGDAITRVMELRKILDNRVASVPAGTVRNRKVA